MTFSALGGQDFSVSCHLVRRGNLGLLQAHTLDSDTKTILSLGARSFITIEKCLGTNIRQSIVKKPFLAIISENAIEGLDVWVHGQLKGGICRVVFWRAVDEGDEVEACEDMLAKEEKGWEAGRVSTTYRTNMMMRICFVHTLVIASTRWTPSCL